MYKETTGMESLHNKTIKEIIFDDYDEVLLIRFTDEMFLVITAERMNCSGQCLKTNILHPRKKTKQHERE